MQNEITITLRGQTLLDIGTQAAAIVAQLGTGTDAVISAATTKQGKANKVSITKTVTTKTVPGTAVEVDDFLSATNDDIEETQLELESIEESEDAAEEVAIPAPKKVAKVPKLTTTEVNEACVAHARRHGGKKATAELLLKKFKVRSVLELKPDQYAPVIAAMAK